MTENVNEIWKSLDGIVDFGEYYEVSNFGNVRSLDRVVNSRNGGRTIVGQEMSNNWLDKDGYVRTMFYHESEKKHYGVHRLVAMAFLPNPDNKPLVNHKDGIKNNNHLSNLEWATHSENQQHAIAMGLKEGVKGEENHNAKLSDNDVVEIFKKYKTNKFSMQDLADEYDVVVSVIHNIVNGIAWKHLNLGVHKRDMSAKSIINDELITRVKELNSLGYSKRKIEKEAGVSRTTVTKILENY